MGDDDPEARAYAAEVIGYLVCYAHLANARSLALLADRRASAYELLFSLLSDWEKQRFLELFRSNDDLTNAYIENNLLSPTIDEVRYAHLLASALPSDVLSLVMQVATTVSADDWRKFH